MPYYRRAAKRPRYGKRLKYSVQQKAFSAGVVAVRALHSSLSFLQRLLRDAQGQAPDGQHGTSSRQRRAYLLGNRVRPQGTTPGVLNIDSTAVADMYEPNQFVMNCGIVDPTAGPIRFSSPVSRNPQQRRQHRTSPQADIHKHHGRRRHCSLRYHPLN